MVILMTKRFGKPYFYGSSEFVVKEDETTDVAVTATLANCMISIDYTDDFKHFFPQYNTKLHSNGGDYIEYSSDETRPVFMKPGEISFLLFLTKQNGISGTFEPASITTEARTHYHVTFDANQGNNGEVQLSINFDESVEQENVEIDLSDELMLSPAPRVAVQGFTPDTAIGIIEGTTLSNPVKFTVISTSSLASVKLTTQSQSLLDQGWPAEIDLLNASASQKAQMETLGLSTIGLGNKPGQMAQIDFTKVAKYLSGAEEHRFTIVAKDKLTKVNDPVSLVLSTEPISISLSNAAVGVNETEATAVINYNGEDLANSVKLQIFNSFGAWQDAPITNVTTITRAGQDYNVTFSVPAGTKDMKIRALYAGKVKCEGMLSVRGLSMNILAQNIWATKAIFNVAVASAFSINDIKMYVAQGNGNFSEWTNTTINPTAMTVTLNGLQPGTTYRVSGSPTGIFEQSYGVKTITTENALQPENGNMENWSKITHPKINFISSSFDEYFANSTSEQTYWSTRNPMTTSNRNIATYSYTNPCGTYPTTGASGTAASISTIGWGQGNTWAGNASIIYNKSAGYLFMGNYAYTAGTENFKYGCPFSSRPKSLSFDYTFIPVSGESFKSYVVIENRNGENITELGRGELISGTAVNSFTNITINIAYTNTSMKATHAYIVFISSTADNPDTPNHLSLPFGNAHQGNVLTVDNIKFNY